MVFRLLPNGEVILLNYFCPTYAFGHFLNSILLLLQILFGPFPPPPVFLPSNRWARENPIATWPQNSIHFNQIQTICGMKIRELMTNENANTTIFLLGMKMKTYNLWIPSKNGSIFMRNVERIINALIVYMYLSFVLHALLPYSNPISYGIVLTTIAIGTKTACKYVLK